MAKLPIWQKYKWTHTNTRACAHTHTCTHARTHINGCKKSNLRNTIIQPQSGVIIQHVIAAGQHDSSIHFLMADLTMLKEIVT
uniref:Uncharacterized protein n=1 Tax=Anguilla anguilla TaxID=7936 RepID=A0A0E9RFC2_ANGAN